MPVISKLVKEINNQLEEVIADAFAEVLRISQLEKVDMRTAAHMLAVERVAQAMSLRGIYP